SGERAMDFAYSDEQRMLVDTVRSFVAKELTPHEAEVERDNEVRPELIAEIREKAKAAGLYAANMPEPAPPTSCAPARARRSSAISCRRSGASAWNASP